MLLVLLAGALLVRLTQGDASTSATGGSRAVEPAGEGARVANLWVDPSGGACRRAGDPASYMDQDACSLSSAVDAAHDGDMILFKTGEYGEWTGTSKPITLKAEPGESPTMWIVLGDGDEGFTIDGMGGMGGSIIGSVRNVTIRNSTFTDVVRIEVRDSGIVFERNRHENIDFRADAPAGRITLFAADGESGVTIRDSLFRGGSADGIQTDTGVTIESNEFAEIVEGKCGDCHTDPIQVVGGADVVIRGNWIHRSSSGIVAFDGSERLRIEHNVVGPRIERASGIDLYSDTDSVVRRNTIVEGKTIMLDRKPSEPSGSGTAVLDNIAGEISAANGSTWGARAGNLLARGAVVGDTTGVPTFADGTESKHFAGFALAPESAGKGTATKGVDPGALSAGFDGGPRAR